MTLVRYDGPGRRLVAFGKTIDRGEADEFTEQELRSLQAQPHIHIAVLPTQPAQTASRPSEKGSRRQWAAYAAEQGVEVTDDMTRDQIIAALDGGTAASSGDGEPEAETGEGHPNNPDPKE
jgi:hypothetical protein